MNMHKISSVVQEANETSGDFNERLCEAYQVYTPFDPEAAANQHMVNATFVARAAPDIRRKLQQLERFVSIHIFDAIVSGILKHLISFCLLL